MKLLEFTKEGLIVKALMEKPLRYTELKRATRLSHAWLSKKLQELQNLGVIISQEGQYRIEPAKLQEALKNEKSHIAMMIAQEIAKAYDVVGIILFGSLARNQAKEGDIDLLVVTIENNIDEISVSLEMLRRFGVAVDILHITFKELLTWLYEPPQILFGMLSGYEVLYDVGYITPFLKALKQETLKNWIYLPEKQLWLKKELSTHISRQRKNT